jgi:ketosteroid isomerase-like protein
MSQENVEIVRQSLEAYGRGEIEEMLSYVDPEGELHSAIIGGAEAKVFRGHDGFRRWFAETVESFEELNTELAALERQGRPATLPDLRDDFPRLAPSTWRGCSTFW